MDIRELRSFVLLAGQLHFGRAAKLLHLSQPALTKQIHKMEEELGGALFERGKQGTVLSSLGEQFLGEARETLQRFDRLVDRGTRAAKGEIGQLNLGFGFHTFELVPRLIVKLREMSPGIDVTLRDMSSAEQEAALEERSIDLGFLRVPVAKGLRSLPAVRDRMAIVTSSESKLPQDLKLSDCRREPFVTIAESRAPGFYNHTIRLCARHGFHPRIVQQVPELTTTVALVRAGLGIAMIPESFRRHRFEGLRWHRLKDKEAAWSVSAAWHPDDKNPALARFLELLRQDLKTSRSPEE
ncbi:MAG: LysR family transcriptional regulator [Verrucomicrobiaceae bacterium]|nr:MAG: LysR family transcriptional regulator [Verrucomicrobiaceae bacterium]